MDVEVGQQTDQQLQGAQLVMDVLSVGHGLLHPLGRLSVHPFLGLPDPLGDVLGVVDELVQFIE